MQEKIFINRNFRFQIIQVKIAQTLLSKPLVTLQDFVIIPLIHVFLVQPTTAYFLESGESEFYM